MALNIKNDEAHGLARAITLLTGETLTAAVTAALRDRLAELTRVAAPIGLLRAEVEELQEAMAALPDRGSES
jgi:antitoxin VapB